MPKPPRPGSPQWWRQQERQAQDLAPSNLSIDQITGAAIRLIDRRGLDGLSMRKLADELGTGTTTLYRKVDGRDALLVYVLDAVLGEPPAHHVVESGPWTEKIADMARAFRTTLLRHPHVVPLFMLGVPIGPNALAGREAYLQVLTEGGLSLDEAASAQLALIHYVIGFVMQEVGAAAQPARARAEITRFVERQRPEAYPHLVKAAAPLLQPDHDREFEFGLTSLIAGMAASH